MSKDFHAKDEKIGRYGISLSDATRRSKAISQTIINNKGMRHRRNATRDHINPFGREVEKPKGWRFKNPS